MLKQEFLARLRKALSGLGRGEIGEQLVFYGEMIDDRMEEGLDEEEAVAQIGSVEEIAAQVLRERRAAELPGKGTAEKRRLRGWEILLLVLGSPIWLSLLLAALALALSLYVAACAIVLALWAVPLALAAGFLYGVLAALPLGIASGLPLALAGLGAGLLCGGLAIPAFFGCRALSALFLRMTGRVFVRRRRG